MDVPTCRTIQHAVVMCLCLLGHGNGWSQYVRHGNSFLFYHRRKIMDFLVLHVVVYIIVWLHQRRKLFCPQAFLLWASHLWAGQLRMQLSPLRTYTICNVWGEVNILDMPLILWIILWKRRDSWSRPPYYVCLIFGRLSAPSLYREKTTSLIAHRSLSGRHLKLN